MDDTKTDDAPEATVYTLTIKDKDHQFRPLDANRVAKLGTILHMRPSPMVMAEMAFDVLAAASLDWDGILRRYIEGELEPADIIGAMQQLANSMKDDATVSDAAPTDAQ